jgi:hypothetical protein
MLPLSAVPSFVPLPNISNGQSLDRLPAGALSDMSITLGHPDCRARQLVSPDLMKRENSFEKSREEELFDLTAATAEACEARLSAESVLLFVGHLLPYTDVQIAAGLARCRAEIKPVTGFVTFSVAIVLEKMGVVCGKDRERAEGTQAWDAIAEQFYTCGDCDFQHFSIEKVKLSPRGQAALRMIGGSRRITGTRAKDIHFVQKDFLEAFATAKDVESLRALPPGASPVGALLSGLVGAKALG